MITAFRLAGHLAAHAVWCVSDGATLIPMLGYTDVNDKRVMERLMGDDLAASVERGRGRLEQNPMDANDAVLIYEAYLRRNDGARVDAILVDVRSYAFPDARASVAIPFTPFEQGGFKVHRAILAEWTRCEDFEQAVAMDAFFAGVDSHEEGSKVWQAALDTTA